MNEETIAAWRSAARDLGIEVVAPYTLIGGVPRTEIECIALVKGFGASVGTVVLGRHSQSRYAALIADARGMYLSLIDERSYAVYERSLFMETLNDWRWFGESRSAPKWYSGQSWE